jgi:hypothetical protein
MFAYRNSRMQGQAPSLVDTSGTTLLIGLSTFEYFWRLYLER